YLDGGLAAATRLVLVHLGHRIGQAADGPGGRDYKTRLQELAAARGISRRATSCATRGPITPRSSSRPCCSTARRRATARANRRRKPSRRRFGTPGRVGRRGARVPELPEIEVLRRDLERDIVGRKIKSVEVDGLKPIRRHRTKKAFIGALDGHKITGVERHGR